MNSVATRVALLLTLFAIVFANIEIDVTDSVADELNSLDAVENRYNSLSLSLSLSLIFHHGSLY